MNISGVYEFLVYWKLVTGDWSLRDLNNNLTNYNLTICSRPVGIGF